MQPDGAEPLVLIPGLLCTGALFKAQMEVLGATRPVIVADHTRHGSMDALATGILAAAPPLFALGGLSMGGYVALAILRQAPERVTRLALMDTSARADRPEQSARRRELVELGRREGVRRVQEVLLPSLLNPAHLGDAALVATVLRMADDTGQAAFERQQEAIIGRPDNRPLLADIRCFTLIVVGAEDQLTPVKVAEEMHAGIPGSRLEIVPGCGHLSPLEQPDGITRLLGDWLGAPAR